MLSQKHNAQYASRIGTLAKSTARVGHFLRDDTTENKKYISSVLDLFSIPNFYIRKGRPHGHRYGEERRLQRIPHGKTTSKEVSKETIRKHSRSIHPRHVVQKDNDRVGVALKKSSLKWTDLQAKTTVILPQKKKLMSIVPIGGSVQIW